ncbi:MAG: pyridoxal phosphate-dependent aminotransferase [Firmicutes bacterium]|nr:pyridoxal phosphate-dependent aminotransferase [Bacillota bacterium]
MKYNFDEIIERKNTDSLKYDYAEEMHKPADLLPLWVADMDFRIPPEATAEIQKSVDHAIYGYTITKDDYLQVVQSWFYNNFDFQTQKEWLVKTPGIVFALATAVKAFTAENDAILIQKPVYYPFDSVIVNNNRKLINNPLQYKNGKYYINFEDFEQKIAENKVKMFILCSPHNPVSRVWTTDELYNMGKICQKYDCIVVSDEIHCDIVFEGFKHTVFSNVSTDFLQNCVICTAPSKTFNLAGLQVSNIFIPNERLRKSFIQEIAKTGYSQHNTLGLTACKAVYRHGKEWRNQLMQYLQSNVDFIQNFLSQNLPQIKMVQPEGTYLIWLDFTALEFDHQQIDEILLQKAKIWLSSGVTFGKEGKGFQRINIACPQQQLQTAFERLQKSLTLF